LKHPLNAGIHLFFFDEFAAVELVNAYLHLFLKPFIVRKQARDGFLHQFVSPPARAGGQIVQLRFLVVRQMDFHAFRITADAARRRAKHARWRYLCAGSTASELELDFEIRCPVGENLFADAPLVFKKLICKPRYMRVRCYVKRRLVGIGDFVRQCVSTKSAPFTPSSALFTSDYAFTPTIYGR
jgi:hypothetical protein